MSRGPQTPLDVFATLATSPALNSASYLRPSGQHFSVHPPRSSPNNIDQSAPDGERPHKRMRQDHTLGTNNQAAYPHVSTFTPISPSQVAVEDAELLLGLWNPPNIAHKRDPVVQPLSAPAQILVQPNSPPRVELLQPSKIEEEQQPRGVNAEAALSNVSSEPMNEQVAASGLSAVDSDTPFPGLPDNKDLTGAASEQKTRVYKGWPKGKPRGPRQAPYAKRGTKTGSKKSQGDGGPGQGSASGSTGSPAPSGADMSMEYLAEIEDGDSLLAGLMQSQHQAASELDGDTKVTRAVEEPTVDLPASTDSAQPARTRSPNKQTAKDNSDDLCAACHNTRTSDLQDFWISCNGCKSWFHHTCVGFH